MTIPTPPVGARVRHTSIYPDLTAVIVEGVVMPYEDGLTTPHVIIGSEQGLHLHLHLVDQPGFTVAVEVLEPPAGPVLPPEPPNETVYVVGTQVWRRDDGLLDPEKDRWWNTHREDGEPWEVVAPIVAGGGWRRHIPDPADTAPALPWKIEDKDEDRLEIQVADAEGIAAMVSVNNESVYLAPAAAREAAGVLLRAVREFEERQP